MPYPLSEILNAGAAALLARGVLLGLGAAVPIGPVNVEIARRTLRNGFRAGFALGCGAVTVDVAYAVLSSLSFTRVVVAVPWVLPLVTAAGVLLLAYLGVMCLRAARRAARVDPLADAKGLGEGTDVAPRDGAAPTAATTAPPPPAPRDGAASAGTSAAGAYAAGVGMTALNPMTLLFWFTVVPGQIPKADRVALPMICAGVFIGTVAWVVTFAGLLGWAGGRYGHRRAWLAAADAAGGAILLAFAAAGLLRLVRPFL